MSKINILDESIFNKISAGEVVERPSSVVKELLDNAIDAGATNISVSIEDGGIKNITVADDGCGIEPDDFDKVFLSHSTSKIKTAEDLEKIGTLGFRGEALASIASVAKVKLTSKVKSQTYARMCNVEGGKQSSTFEVGGDDGTIMSVSDLFFNVPARAKFLKKPKAEMLEITNLIERYILCNPSISFKYVADGKNILQSTGTNLYDAIYVVYGKTACDGIVPVNYVGKSSGITVTGYIGLPTFSKPNRTYQTLSINGRYVMSSLVSTCVYNAYEHYLMKGQFPFYVLNLQLPHQNLDVNVHPTKMEVRFNNTSEVFGTVYNAVSTALYNADKITSPQFVTNYSNVKNGSSFSVNVPEVQQGAETAKVVQIDSLSHDLSAHDLSAQHDLSCQNQAEKSNQNANCEKNYNCQTGCQVNKLQSFEYSSKNLNDNPSNENGSSNSTIYDVNARTDSSKRVLSSSFGEIFSTSAKSSGTLTLNQPQNSIVGKLVSNFYGQTMINETTLADEKVQKVSKTEEFFATSDVKFVGQIFSLYLIVEKQDKVYIIDEHAGHERLLFDRLVKEVDSRQVTKQTLLAPYTVDVNKQEYAFIDENIDKFEALGFEIAPFGSSTFVVTTVPAILQDISIKSFFDEILKDLNNMKSLKQSDLILSKLMQHSCKCAVRAGKILSAGEVNSLIESMKQENMQLQCPHGRPVVVELTKTEVEKWFKRIV